MAANTKFQVIVPSKPFAPSIIDKGGPINNNKRKLPLFINNSSKHNAGCGTTNIVAPYLSTTATKDITSAIPTSAAASSTGSHPPVVKVITADLVDRTTDIVCAAFKDDPLFTYVLQPIGGVDARPDLHRLFQGIYVSASIKHGMAYQVDDLGSIALFFPPGADVAESWADLLKMLSSVPLAALTRYLIDFVTPSELAKRTHLGIGTKAERRYYNLSIAATRPDKQGKGLLKHVLKPALARADAEDAVVWLESTKERNVPIYERFGFKVVETITLKDESPIFLMLREPQPLVH
ncbi:hypothetical protein SeMB42_g01159 [Synchytrium endobioticum]|uniref:N-acetyltransferase domain-containing protein n=1 Tax=Synchytrium endobioticum TaxID=286115 RepID=A0A507CJF3_9FUNG|nr:hypothetical protein SeLEV6574_g06986 [Synchytrium endobioticum]TPX52831.1 hypothetical protein SeMB42_g01159 [Synchytrium endobioticum]